MNRKACPEWTGIVVRNQPESLSGMNRNGCPEWAGIPNIASSSYVAGIGNIFSCGNTEYATLFFSSQSTSGLTGNDIIKGDGPAVTLRDYNNDHHVIDLSNNYWGATDITTIEEWVHDGNDDPTIHATVNFLPLADGPVSTEPTTFDELKALSR